MVILECFSLQSKLQMHLHCCSKHWHKVDVITGLSQGATKAIRGTEIKKLFLDVYVWIYVDILSPTADLLSLSALRAAAPGMLHSVPY